MPEPAAASFRLAALAEALHRAGAKVTVLTAAPYRDAVAQIPGVTIRTSPVKRDHEGYVRGYTSYLSFDLPLMLRLLPVKRPDIVVAEPPPTTGAVVRAATALRNVPYAYYAADIWSDAAASAGVPSTVLRALASVERGVLGSADLVLSVSEGVTQRLSQLGVRRTVVTVGNGVDLGAFTRTGPLPAVGGPYFVYAGTASEFQGATIFAEAFVEVQRLVPGARLVVLGQGSDLSRIARTAARLPDGTIVLMGRQPPQIAAQWLRGAVASLVSIRPGVGYDFARPTKIYASAACGTPVIFAGPAPTQDYVRANRLGRASDFSASRLRSEMLQALQDPPSPTERQRLADWAERSVSLQAAAERAAEAVLRTTASR